MPTAIVTGGNKGLGLAQTKLLLENGYSVHVVARSEGELQSLVRDVSLHRHDLSNWSETCYLDEIHRQAGRINLLVNNAGMHLKKPIWEVSPQELEERLDLNVKSVFAACGRYVELHRDCGGAIVNISSMGGLLALPSAAAYVTAKTAIVGLTRSVAVDAAQFGIRCNAVAPGFIDTEMTRAILEKDPDRRKKIEGRIPGGAFGRPEDVAYAVCFLGSENAAHINGVVLPVDGGFSIGF